MDFTKKESFPEVLAPHRVRVHEDIVDTWNGVDLHKVSIEQHPESEGKCSFPQNWLEVSMGSLPSTGTNLYEVSRPLPGGAVRIKPLKDS